MLNTIACRNRQAAHKTSHKRVRIVCKCRLFRSFTTAVCRTTRANPTELRGVLTTIQQRHGIQSLEECYKITRSMIEEHDEGKRLLALFSGSHAELIMAAYPDHHWKPWKFTRVPSGWWHDVENQRSFWSDLRHELGLDTLESLYQITRTQIIQYGGRGLMQLYNESPLKALQVAYPNHEWQPWRFINAPRNWWNERKNQLDFWNHVKQQYNFTQLSDFYKLSKLDIIRVGGGGIMSKYDSSPFLALKAAYPEHEWLPWLFTTPPRNWSDSPEYRLKFWEWFSKEHGFTSLHDFYKLSSNEVEQLRRTALLERFGGSLSKALNDAYPNHEWHDWLFSCQLHNWEHWWNDPQSRSRFFQWFAETRSFRTLEDWYNVSIDDIENAIGGQLAPLRKEPLASIIRKTYPQHKWLNWKFKNLPHGYWMNLDNQREFCDWLRSELKWDSLAGWYTATASDIIEHGGEALWSKYRSVATIAMTVYPDHPWEPWKFRRWPPGLAASIRHAPSHERQRILREVLEEIGSRIGVRSLTEWYYVSRDRLGSLTRRIAKLGGLSKALQLAYPEHKWQTQRFLSREKRSLQKYLKSILSAAYDFDVTEEYTVHYLRLMPEQLPLQLDLYVKDNKIALEVQGIHHFFDVMQYGEHEARTQKDEAKAAVCGMKQIVLVEVPYWWDRRTSSLQRTLQCFLHV